MDEKYLEMAEAATILMIEEGVRASGVAQRRPPDFEGFCTCGAEVLPVRLAHGFFNCVDCQTKLERHNKLHRRE